MSDLLNQLKLALPDRYELERLLGSGGWPWSISPETASRIAGWQSKCYARSWQAPWGDRKSVV